MFRLGICFIIALLINVTAIASDFVCPTGTRFLSKTAVSNGFYTQVCEVEIGRSTGVIQRYTIAANKKHNKIVLIKKISSTGHLLRTARFNNNGQVSQIIKSAWIGRSGACRFEYSSKMDMMPIQTSSSCMAELNEIKKLVKVERKRANNKKMCESLKGCHREFDTIVCKDKTYRLETMKDQINIFDGRKDFKKFYKPKLREDHRSSNNAINR